MRVNYEVATYNQITGSHFWRDAPAKLSYLRNVHRHVFAIRCWFAVSHTDREIEINQMQQTIADHFRLSFVVDEAGVNFGGMSCEDIAEYCIKTFGCVQCEVFEDGFGGACVYVSE